jgi:hypothetical protein
MESHRPRVLAPEGVLSILGAGERAAIMYTLIQTAMLNGVDPYIG